MGFVVAVLCFCLFALLLLFCVGCLLYFCCFYLLLFGFFVRSFVFATHTGLTTSLTHTEWHKTLMISWLPNVYSKGEGGKKLIYFYFSFFSFLFKSRTQAVIFVSCFVFVFLDCVTGCLNCLSPRCGDSRYGCLGVKHIH